MKNTVKRIIAILLCVCLTGSVVVAAGAASVDHPQEDYDYWQSLWGTSSMPDEATDAYAVFANYLNGIFNNIGNVGPVQQETNGSFTGTFILFLRELLARVLNAISNLVINNGLAGGLAALVPGTDAVERYEDFDLAAYEGFMAGMDTFNTEVGENNVWSLGYSEKSILPADFGETSYAKGAYLPDIYGSEMYKDDDGNDEDLRVRTVILDDGSGRGSAVFAVIDAIGIANADVRLIREALADFAAENNIVSINVSCTHIHTGIDLQGIWTKPVTTLSNNIFRREEVRYGVDRTFLQSVIDSTVASVTDAYADMKTGKLWFSSADISEYVHDRTAPYALDSMLYKLEFLPDDPAATPTVIATFGCHPESASYDWNAPADGGRYDTKFSADFIWYMEKIMNAAGYNFIYIQGDVGTVTSSRGLTNDGMDLSAHETAVRYGYELGYITLTLNMTYEERIRVNEATGDKLGVAEGRDNEDYTVWYEGLETVPAEEVAPLLNIAHDQFIIPVQNNLIAAAGKVSLVDNLVLRDKVGNYYTVTEVGYMELGDTLKVYLSPGETFGELLVGGDGLKGFPYASIRDTLGGNVIVMDLMNDAAGYVENDAIFVYAGIQYADEANYDGDSWGIVSYGEHTGSILIGKLYALADRVKGGE